MSEPEAHAGDVASVSRRFARCAQHAQPGAALQEDVDDHQVHLAVALMKSGASEAAALQLAMQIEQKQGDNAAAQGYLLRVKAIAPDASIVPSKQ